MPVLTAIPVPRAFTAALGRRLPVLSSPLRAGAPCAGGPARGVASGHPLPAAGAAAATAVSHAGLPPHTAPGQPRSSHDGTVQVTAIHLLLPCWHAFCLRLGPALLQIRNFQSLNFATTLYTHVRGIVS